jgi:high-affinity Fe2+/Pb2+ permease
MESMEPLNMRRKRWNLLGFVASIITTFVMIGLIIYGQEHRGQLEVVLSVLVVILIVALFAIISSTVKRNIKNKLNKRAK